MSRRRPPARRPKPKGQLGLPAVIAFTGVGILVVALGAVLLVVLSGGGDDDDGNGGPSPVAAADVLPDLGDLGFTLAERGQDPGVPPGQDMARARYLANNGGQVLMRVYLLATTEEAFDLYGTVVQAYATIPIQALVGSDPTQPDTSLPGGPANVVSTGPDLGEQHTSYETTRPDSQGNAVWTDIYLDGRWVIAVQYLAAATTDSMTPRTEIASRILAAR